MNNVLLPRIGTFFLLVGCAFLILFVISISAGEVHTSYLLYAIAALFVGLALRGRPPKKEPTRFIRIRKAAQRSHHRHGDEKPSAKTENK